MIFKNLKAEMARENLTILDFSKNPKLCCTYTTLRNKFSKKTEWTRKEMLIIRDDYFPDKTLEYLFEE